MARQIRRSEFIQLSAAALAGLVLSEPSCKNAGRKIDAIGLQLYSVREVFEKEPAETIRQLAAMGYKQLESYERNEDFFWGLTNKGFKSLMDELGMSLISTHCDPENNFEKKVELASEIGMKYLIYNWPSTQQSRDEYLKKAELFNRCGETCKKAGMRFGYHNYSSSYQLLDGIYPQDLLMERTDPSLVDHQMDIYWVWRAGQDPRHWLKKYPRRYRLSHIKDGNNQETSLLGKGRIDLASILSVGIDNGMEYFIVEQEHYGGMSPMECAKANAIYMQNLSL